MQFLTDFCELNKKLLHKLFLLPKINDITQILGHFVYATILNLPMDYYYLPLDNKTIDLYSICLPFSIFKYEYLP